MFIPPYLKRLISRSHAVLATIGTTPFPIDRNRSSTHGVDPLASLQKVGLAEGISEYMYFHPSMSVGCGG